MKKNLKSNGRLLKTPPSPFLSWSLVISLILAWGDWRVAAEGIRDGDASNGISGNGENDHVVFIDPTRLDSTLGETKWTPLLSSAGQPTNKNPLNQFIFAKDKRSVYGLLGLATKRPHKTAAEIQHLPPQDAFMSVRGKKSPPVRLSPFQRTYSILLPGDSFY